MPSLLLEERSRVERWIRRVAASYGYQVGSVHYQLCTDEEELRVNEQFLGHTDYTDSIAFDYSTATTLSGDIFLSLERIADNAKTQQVDEQEELRRLLIHGILHFTGQADKSPEARQEMTHKEDAALALW